MSGIWFLVSCGGAAICGGSAAQGNYGAAIGGALIALAGILVNFGVAV